MTGGENEEPGQTIMAHIGDKDREPIAGISAASSCIRLSLCSPKSEELLTFRPVYTHQCFQDEFLPGWRPLVNAEDEARHLYQSWKTIDEDCDFHPSFNSCQIEGSNNNSRVDVHVELAPSCTTCEVDIKAIECEDITNKIGESAPKKPKLVRFELPSNEKKQQMALCDIVQKISSAVPPITNVRLNGVEFEGWISPEQQDKNSSFEYLEQPIGRVLKSYQRKMKGRSQHATFVITIAPGVDGNTSKYHASVQRLARWFIETADDVDIDNDSDDSGGFWSVLYLFREHSVICDDDQNKSEQRKVRYSLAGYTTLFHFHAPFKKPEPGIVVRVCQALILPPYQRAGHGSDMLHSVYEYAEEFTVDGQKIVEVNVEDPAPGFVALRDFVDYRRYLSCLLTSIKTDDAIVTDKHFFSPVSDEKLQEIATSLKITKRQAQRVHELHKLEQLQKWKNHADDNSTIEEKETQYRLMIKKTLRSIRKEELGACTGGKEEQKVLLERWFQETSAHYRRLLGSGK